ASGMSITFDVASDGSVTMGDSAIPFTSNHKQDQAHNDGNVTLYDHKVLAGVILTKVDHDETTKVLSGAAVDLYKDGVLYGKYTTDDNGKVIVNNLAIGSYEFKETKAPVGYAVNNSDTFTFTVSEADFRTDDSKVYSLTMKDKKTDVGFETKIETGNRVNGATESAIEALGNVTVKVYEDQALTRFVKDLVSESNGTVSLKSELNEGTYYIKLYSSVSENVILNSNIFKLVVSDNSKLINTLDGSEVTDKSIVSTLDMADLEFVKVDATDVSKRLKNSTYGLFLKNASKARMTEGDSAVLNPADDTFVKVGETVSATDGAVKFTGLYAGGIYEIRELEAPAGYQLSKNPVEITVKRTAFISSAHLTASGSATVTTDASGNLIWHEPRLYLRLDKVDEKGDLLPGAELQLIDKATGAIIDSWISDDISGHLVSGVSAEAIKGGNTYILREVKEPDGYVKAADIEFVAKIESLAPSDPDFIQVVTMIDKKYVAPVYGGFVTKPDKEVKEPDTAEDAGNDKPKKPVNPHKQPEAAININDRKPLPKENDNEKANEGPKSPKTGQKRNIFINLFMRLL
ncbi:MAG: hypothetical protein J6Z02_04860, partial [Lachnospiraceae bacterium]|nr:hypothetical protein [Lachnospiraceae bacterium]